MSRFKKGIQVPKVVKELDLGDYHPELKGEVFHVWVNLSRAAHKAYFEFQSELRTWGKKQEELEKELEDKTKEAIKGGWHRSRKQKISDGYAKFFTDHMDDFDKLSQSVHDWYSEIWSQAEDTETHISTMDVRVISEVSQENDNNDFWIWLTKQTQAMILGYRNRHLKK